MLHKDEMGKEYEVIKTMKGRKLKYLKLIMREQQYEMLRLSMEGKLKRRSIISRGIGLTVAR